jgi:hypothetical protein
LQQDELEKQQEQANSVKDRVKILEEDLANTKALIKKTLIALETHLTQDIDGDGKMG